MMTLLVDREWGSGRVWGNAQWETQEGNIFGIPVTHFRGELCW